MQLTLDSAILEHLLARAVTASRLIGHIDERAAGPLVGRLEDSLDEIVHVLSELLGNPHVVVAPVPTTCSSLALDIATHGDVGTQIVRAEIAAPDVPVGGAPCAVPALAGETRPVSASGAGGAR